MGMGMRQIPQCTFCNKLGHVEAWCWNKNPNLRPLGGQQVMRQPEKGGQQAAGMVAPAQEQQQSLYAPALITAPANRMTPYPTMKPIQVD